MDNYQEHRSKYIAEKTSELYSILLDIERVRHKFNSYDIRTGKGFYKCRINQESISKRFNRSSRQYRQWLVGEHYPTDPNCYDRLIWIANEIYNDINSYVHEDPYLYK